MHIYIKPCWFDSFGLSAHRDRVYVTVYGPSGYFRQAWIPAGGNAQYGWYVDHCYLGSYRVRAWICEGSWFTRHENNCRPSFNWSTGTSTNVNVSTWW